MMSFQQMTVNTPEDLEKLIKLNWDSFTKSLIECASPDVFIRQDMENYFKELRYTASVKNIQIQDIYAEFINGTLKAKLSYILDTYTDKYGQLINPTGINPFNSQVFQMSPGVQPIVNYTREVILLYCNISDKLSKEEYQIPNRWELELD